MIHRWMKTGAALWVGCGLATAGLPPASAKPTNARSVQNPAPAAALVAKPLPARPSGLPAGMAEKDREIERLWKFYFESVPYAITPLPMNMEYLDSQPYSGAFRKKYPKVNGLFWGYHWLQGGMYDMLYRVSPAQQRDSYEVTGD